MKSVSETKPPWHFRFSLWVRLQQSVSSRRSRRKYAALCGVFCLGMERCNGSHFLNSSRISPPPRQTAGRVKNRSIFLTDMQPILYLDARMFCLYFVSVMNALWFPGNAMFHTNVPGLCYLCEMVPVTPSINLLIWYCMCSCKEFCFIVNSVELQ